MKKSVIATVLSLSIPFCGWCMDRSPYNGTPASIPGTIEIEEFDKGGEGVAYHDEEEENQGELLRLSEGVDIDASNDGYVVGWTIKGEWLEYTVNVLYSDEYVVDMVTASNLDNSAFSLLLDGEKVTPTVSVPNTEGWTNFTTLSFKTSRLEAGEHVLRLSIESSYCNLDKMVFRKKNPLFVSPNKSSNVYADESFSIEWEASELGNDKYNLNWVDVSGKSILLKEDVSGTDSYETVVPADYEGAQGHYSLSKLVTTGGAVPSDFDGQMHTVTNPLIWSDVPDVATIRVGDTYYMVSTTMHLNPGVPVMASKDLVRWRTISYAHQALANNDNLNMTNGKNAYGKGSWASSIRYKDGTWYVLTPSYTTGGTHIFKTKDIYSGEWESAILPFYHDPSLFIDDDGRVYVIYGATDISIVELSADAMSVKSNGLKKQILSKPASIAGSSFYVQAEGSQVMKKDGYYYVFLISWPAGACRSVLCYRTKDLGGTYEGKVLLQDNGVAQGGIFDTPEGDWYGLFFRDNGSVGRIPYLLPVSWKDNWPVLGNNSKVPSTLSMPAAQEDGFGVVTSDEFEETELPLEWQWNHNPVASGWQLTDGKMRITNTRTDADVESTQNTLTQRSFGPNCTGWTKLSTKGMKNGDYAGLVALQEYYGFAGVKMSGNSKSIVMMTSTSVNDSRVVSEAAQVPLNQDEVWLRIDMNYQKQTDKANFYYSLDGKSWTKFGSELSMSYKLTHFMGYRYGLFNYGTQSTGGYADFDFFRIGKDVNSPIYLSKETKTEEVTVAESITITVVKKGTTDAKDVAAATYSVLPNPASDYIQVSGVEEITRLELSSLSGEVLLVSDTNPLDISTISEGVYLLTIQTPAKRWVEKVIIR